MSEEVSEILRQRVKERVGNGRDIFSSVFWVGIYSAAVEDKLAQFTDICSLSNIRYIKRISVLYVQCVQN